MKGPWFVWIWAGTIDLHRSAAASMFLCTLSMGLLQQFHANVNIVLNLAGHINASRVKALHIQVDIHK